MAMRDSETRSSRAGNCDANDDAMDWEGYSFRAFVDQVAREHGAHLMDCLAEAVSNDPFNAGGTESQRKMARWFRDVWRQLGSPTDAYVRGFHYRAGSLGTVRLPWGRFNGLKVGKPVHNKAEIDRLEREHPEWKRYLWDPTCADVMGEAANEARLTGLVDIRDVEDRRTPNPKIWARPMDEPGTAIASTPLYNYETDEYDAPEYWGVLPDVPERPSYTLAGYHSGEANAVIRRERSYYHVEIWCEKSDIEKQLRGVCSEYGVNFVAGMGELSIPAVLDFLDRVEESGRSAARILYISDLDAQGVEMPKSIATKIAWALKHRMEREDAEWLDIGLHPIALTLRQAKELQLPSSEGKLPADMAKESQSNNFERTFKIKGKIELNALDATLQPDILARLVRDWLDRYQDADLPRRIRHARTGVTELLVPLQAGVHARYEDEYQALLLAHQACIDAITPHLDAYRQKLLAFDAAMRADLEAELEAVEDDLPDFPEADDAGADEPESLLYHSGRTYWDQLQAFKTKLIEVHGLDGDQAEAALLKRSEKKAMNRAARGDGESHR